MRLIYIALMTGVLLERANSIVPSVIAVARLECSGDGSICFSLWDVDAGKDRGRYWEMEESGQMLDHWMGRSACLAFGMTHKTHSSTQHAHKHKNTGYTPCILVV